MLVKFVCSLLVLSITCLFSLHSKAQLSDKYWTAASGNLSWHTSSNWSPTGIPGNTDDVKIGSPATANPIVFSSGIANSITVTSNLGIDVDNGNLTTDFMTLEGYQQWITNLSIEGSSNVTIVHSLNAGTKAGQYASVYQQNGSLTTGIFFLGNFNANASGRYILEVDTELHIGTNIGSAGNADALYHYHAGSLYTPFINIGGSGTNTGKFIQDGEILLQAYMSSNYTDITVNLTRHQCSQPTSDSNPQTTAAK